MHQWPESPNDFPLGDGRFAADRRRPASVEELASLAGRLASEGQGIYPQGGRTSLDSGGVPGLPGVVVDTTALDRVIDYPAADMTITVEAGITLAALQRVLAEHGQRLPLEAPRPDRATLGGIYATNTSGPRRPGWGRPRDLIIGVGFATSSGELVKGGGRVVKNVAGYDFPKLLTGSFGSLGVIAYLTMKVRPKPEASALLAFGLPDARAAATALDRLNASDTRPVGLELLNANAARATGFAADSPWLLMVGFEGTRTAVDWQLGAIAGEMPTPPVARLAASEAEAAWSRIVESQQVDGPGWTFRANLPTSAVAGFAAEWDQEVWTLQGQAGSGVVWGHASTDAPNDQVEAAIRRMRARAVERGGNLVLPRCPTERKGPMRVWGEPRADWALSQRVQRVLDPSGLMNPGRFIGTM